MVSNIESEYCFNVQISEESLDSEATSRLEWLLRETFEPSGLQLETSTFTSHNDDNNNDDNNIMIVEFGPRKTFTSAFSSNATSICAACGLAAITRLERSCRYRITYSPPSSSSSFSSEEDTTLVTTTKMIKSLLHDRMTEEEYSAPVTSFHSGATVNPVTTVPIMEEGKVALMRINNERGLGFDDFDLNFYTDLFKVCHIYIYILFSKREREYIYIYVENGGE